MNILLFDIQIQIQQTDLIIDREQVQAGMATFINSTALDLGCLHCSKGQSNHHRFIQEQLSAVQDFANCIVSQAKDLIDSISKNISQHFLNQQTEECKSEDKCNVPLALPKNEREKTEFVQIPLVSKHSDVKSPEQSQSLSKTLYEIDSITQEIFPYKRLNESQINLTQIDLKLEQTVQADELYIHQMVQELNNQIKLFDFKVRRNQDSFYFDIGEKKVTLKREDEKLMQLIADRPILKELKQRIGIRVLNNKKGWIYFGLMNELQMKEKSIAKAKNKNMISYKISGGKQLHVPTSAECISVPQVPQNSCLYMETNYMKGIVEFYIDQVKVTNLMIDFAGLQWFPFLTFKHKDDSVELL